MSGATAVKKSEKTIKVLEEPMKSMDGAQVDGALTAPDKKFVVWAKDMVSDELYSNLHPQTIGAPYKMHRFVEKKDGKVKVTFYADNLQEWLTILVPETFQYTIDPRYVDRMTKPVEKIKREKAAKTAHLQKFQKTKPDPEKQPPHGKNVFKGKLGAKVALFDVGDGSTVLTLESGQDLKTVAAKAGKKLVSQGAASAYAIWVFTAQWKAARQKVKA